MNIKAIEDKINQYQKTEKSMFLTSSFQTHSIPLLHIISRIDNTIPVYFNNTGFHFPETIYFKDQMADLLGLKVLETKSLIPKSEQLNTSGNLHYTSDPDYCCYLNKVQPLEPVLMLHDVWINGIRADQSDTRKAMKIEQPAPFNTLRYHPMLNWDNKMILKKESPTKITERVQVKGMCIYKNQQCEYIAHAGKQFFTIKLCAKSQAIYIKNDVLEYGTFNRARNIINTWDIQIGATVADAKADIGKKLEKIGLPIINIQWFYYSSRS